MEEGKKEGFVDLKEDIEIKFDKEQEIDWDKINQKHRQLL